MSDTYQCAPSGSTTTKCGLAVAGKPSFWRSIVRTTDFAAMSTTAIFASSWMQT